ncbi:MAG TPA: hypothetical protein VGK95_02640, partial [Caldimonas sp.]
VGHRGKCASRSATIGSRAPRNGARERCESRPSRRRWERAHDPASPLRCRRGGDCARGSVEARVRRGRGAIKRRTAAAIGLKIPASILLRADRVIR